MPQLEEVGDNFCPVSRNVQKLNCPKLRKVGEGFLIEHPEREKFLQMIKANAISSGDIARLDKDTQLTVAEVSYAGMKLNSKEISKDIEISK